MHSIHRYITFIAPRVMKEEPTSTRSASATGDLLPDSADGGRGSRPDDFFCLVPCPLPNPVLSAELPLLGHIVSLSEKMLFVVCGARPSDESFACMSCME